jgi:hypothetical protein
VRSCLHILGQFVEAPKTVGITGMGPRKSLGISLFCSYFLFPNSD